MSKRSEECRSERNPCAKSTARRPGPGSKVPASRTPRGVVIVTSMTTTVKVWYAARQGIRRPVSTFRHVPSQMLVGGPQPPGSGRSVLLQQPGEGLQAVLPELLRLGDLVG